MYQLKGVERLLKHFHLFLCLLMLLIPVVDQTLVVAAAPTVTPRPTLTLRPTKTPRPTATPTITPTPTNTPLPITGKLAFAAGRVVGQDLTYEIYTMDADGSNLTQLTHLKRADGPVWSRDGKQIGFLLWNVGRDAADFMVMDADGSNQVKRFRFVSPAAELTLSPDGKHLLYEYQPGGAGGLANIWISNPDGTNPAHLTFSMDGSFNPSWSPDSQNIVYGTNTGLYKMQANGQNQILLVDRPLLFESAPDWSPDGVHILFRALESSTYNLYMIDADGKNMTQITHFKKSEGLIAKWSPDGKHIAFYGSLDTKQLTLQIYVMEADGSHLVQVTHDEAVSIYDVQWMPQQIQSPTPAS